MSGLVLQMQSCGGNETGAKFMHLWGQKDYAMFIVFSFLQSDIYYWSNSEVPYTDIYELSDSKVLTNPPLANHTLPKRALLHNNLAQGVFYYVPYIARMSLHVQCYVKAAAYWAESCT